MALAMGREGRRLVVVSMCCFLRLSDLLARVCLQSPVRIARARMRCSGKAEEPSIAQLSGAMRTLPGQMQPGPSPDR